jgi:hypothetical protein
MTADLARRAVACKGWRWLPGMLVEGNRVLSVSYTNPPYDYATPYAYVSCMGGPVSLLELERTLPDLRDPATLGCLLALVRDAWGDPRAYLCDYGGYDSVEWGVVSHEWDAKRQAEGPKAWFSCLLGDAGTEAGALVRALEAAP